MRSKFPPPPPAPLVPPNNLESSVPLGAPMFLSCHWNGRAIQYAGQRAAAERRPANLNGRGDVLGPSEWRAKWADQDDGLPPTDNLDFSHSAASLKSINYSTRSPAILLPLLFSSPPLLSSARRPPARAFHLAKLVSLIANFSFTARVPSVGGRGEDARQLLIALK